jgi:UDP-galactopyranose mutase
VVEECAEGLIKADDGNNSKHFEEFILRRFGTGISKHFMLPYNRKLWGRDLKRLAADWTSERVAAPEGVMEEFQSKGGERKPLQDNTFIAYPARGGFGEIFAALGKQIPDVRLNQKVMRIDVEKKNVYTSSGEAFKWHYLVSTLPVNILLDLIESAPSELRLLAARLDYLSLKLGLVVVGHPVDISIQRIYCADEHILPHKTTINHTSSRYLRSLPQHGIMTEISVGPNKKLISKDIEQTIISNLKTMGVLKSSNEVIHSEIRDIEYAYPVPTASRDVIIAEITQWLERNNIYTSGRFGEWAYINSDESLYRGILLGKKLAGN